MKKLLYIGLFFLMLSGLRAQSGLGFVSHATPGLSDTLISGSTITYGVTVLSTGSSPVSGNYTVYIAVNDTSGAFQGIVDSVNVTSTSFQPGDSMQITITHDVDMLYFMEGGNTVVIWPASPDAITTDTIYRDVFVINFDNVDELAESIISISPNPATDFIYIQSKNIIEKVRIYDLQGKIVYTGNGNKIPVNNLNAGYHILEIIQSSEQSSRKKIVILK